MVRRNFQQGEFKDYRTPTSFQFYSTVPTRYKMHIADILSRLAGKDLEPSDQLIPYHLMFTPEVLGH